jgi:hypothetical protein
LAEVAAEPEEVFFLEVQQVLLLEVMEAKAS